MVTPLADEIEKLSPPGPPVVEASDQLIQGDPKAKALGEIGVSGVRIFSGVVNEEYLPELTGPKALKIYRTMADDSIVNAVITAITLMLRAVDWRVEPADKSGSESQSEAEAEFAQSLLDDMSHTWEDTIGEILSMLIYGWSYHEIVLKRRVGPDENDGSKRSAFTDGRIGIRKLPIRSQDTLLKWEMQTDGGVSGMWQQPPMGGAQLFMPIERSLLFRTASRKNSPEGVSILRSAYRPWFFKRHIEDMEAIGIERELAGLPVVSIPKKYLADNASPEDKAFGVKAQQIARDLKFNQQGGVVIPSDMWPSKDGSPSSAPVMKIELLSTGGRRAIETGPIVQRYNRDIARAALADFLTLGDDKGSYALSKNKSELFLRACETYLNQIASVINRFLLPRIFAYNGIDRSLLPTMKPGRVTPVDLAELGAYLQALAGAGAPLFPNQELSEYLADVAGLPEPPEDIGLQAQPGQTPGAGHIDPNTGEVIQPTIDPVSGRPQHEVDRESAQDDLAAAEFMSNNKGPASKRAGPFEKSGGGNPNHDRIGRFATGPSKVPETGPLSDEDWQNLLAESKAQSKLADDITAEVIASPNQHAVFVSSKDPSRKVLISRSLDPDYDLRVTNFDARGASGHREYKASDVAGLRSEVSIALGGGYQLTTLKYNPNHDQRGRFTYSPGIKASGVEETKRVRKEWEKESPFHTVDDLMANSEANQRKFAAVNGQIADETGTGFKDPGPKSRTRLIEKRLELMKVIDRGKPAETVTDAVRGGYTVETPEQADRVIAKLAEHYQIADEGWAMTDAGYFDRKVIARLPDKQLAEVQFWHPEMLAAKEGKGGGHKLYEAQQSLEKISKVHPMIKPIKEAQRQLYGGARARMPAQWGAVHMADL
jgi:hypothetical protein